MPSGPFIVLEGIDGAGTTTQARLLAEWLRGRGRRVKLTREPSEGPVGALIRLALARKNGMGRRRSSSRESHSRPLLFAEDIMAPFRAEGALSDERTLALLFAADRSDHLNTTVTPALEQGLVVVSDRYYLSSVAYQSIAMPMEWVENLNKHFRRPELTVFLDVPPEECLRRVSTRGTKAERYEYKKHLDRILANYRKAIERAASRGELVETLDAAQPIEAVHAAIQKLVAPMVRGDPPE